MMVSAGDLLTLYVGLELQSLAAYVLASFMRRDTRSAEAGLKYFVLGALASGILLYGISLVYGFSGTTLFSSIADRLWRGPFDRPDLRAGVRLRGLAFKISAVPFHMWTPDVYEGAPTPGHRLLRQRAQDGGNGDDCPRRDRGDGPRSPTTGARSSIFAIARLDPASARFGAIGQTQHQAAAWRTSSINNVGFALIGLATGTAQAGVASVLFYMAVYVVMTLGLLPDRAADARCRGQSGRDAGQHGRHCQSTRPWLALAMADLHVQPCRHPAIARLLRQAREVFWAAVPPPTGCSRWRWSGHRRFGAIGRLLLSAASSRRMYFDEPAPKYEAVRARAGSRAACSLAAAQWQSRRLGMLALPCLLGAWSMASPRSRCSDAHDPHRHRRRARPTADLADARAARVPSKGVWLRAEQPEPRARAGRAGRLGSRRPAICTPVRSCASTVDRSLKRRRWHWSRRLRWTRRCGCGCLYRRRW